ncbi:uncharacterized protein LOC127794564 isoform X2 [Diospyros lotus]|nr:uncharacterized protein LOC127794564 isoform X2 [Diospyros lotus]
MHAALQRTCSNTQKVADGKNISVSRKFLEENNRSASSNDREVSCLAWRNTDHRCCILTFFALEPDGHWRVVTLPLQCPNHTIHLGSGFQVKMDGLHLVSPSVVSSVMVSQQIEWRGPTIEQRYSLKSFSARSCSGSKFRNWSQNKGFANKLSRWHALPSNSSSQSSFNSSNSSVVVPCGSTSLSSIHIDISTVGKPVKENLKTEAIKKEKQKKKLPCNIVSTDLENVYYRSLASETSFVKNTRVEIDSLPYATRRTVSLPVLSGHSNDSEGNSSGTITSSETRETCLSYIDEVDEHPPSDSGTNVQTGFPEFSVLSGLEDSHSLLINSSGDPCSIAFCDANDSFVLDSISVSSNGDESMNAVAATKPSNKGPGDSYSRAEGATSSGQGCRSGNMSKRGKNIKKVSRNTCVSCLSSVGKFHGCSGKENSHSIWQKVQKNDTGACTYDLRKFNTAESHSDTQTKGASHCNIAQSSALSSCEDKTRSKAKASRRLKRKTSSVSKQESNYYSGKGLYTIKASSNMNRKINMQWNEVVEIPTQLVEQKRSKGVSRSRSKIGYSRSGFQTYRVESMAAEPVQSSECSPNELELPEHACTTLSSLNDKIATREGSSLSGLLDHEEWPEEQCTEFLYSPDGEEGKKADENVSPMENTKKDHNSGSILQKWIPVGTKDSELAKLGHSNRLQLRNLNKTVVEKCNLGNTVSKGSNDPNNFGASTIQGLRDDNGLQSEDGIEIQKHINQSICISTKCLCHHNLNDQSKCASENDSNNILQAVNHAFKVQLASEAVQMATGCPIAEFERLLSAASPVISLPDNILSCQTPSPNNLVGVTLCTHKAPNISLGSLWQWYEKHGTYGLEVRAEDFENSKRLGIDRFAFRAYFVPFLSAVQLFGNQKIYPSNSSNGFPGTKVKEAHELDQRSGNSSSIDRFPIFSVLVPQPCLEEKSSPTLRNCACCSKMSSVCIDGNATSQSDSSTSSNDFELLFEYFEVEQPQKRRPFFEMIKELVRGDGPSQGRAYGDPTILDSVALNDLHPKSWYSVAWYPIYRIPDGSFRAAFLTYHSLGHLVHRSDTRPTSDSSGTGACAVSPVVGLQSYNAQGECWFQLRQPTSRETTEVLGLDSSGILKERLRTLEKTASLMARSVVTKGNLASTNRQPDYEFFLSRHR